MTWWRRNRDGVRVRKEQADKALELSLMQKAVADELSPRVEEQMWRLHTLNVENNFAAKLAQAYVEGITHGR
jgi:hypothetical protein